MSPRTNHWITRRRFAQGALALPIAGSAVLGASEVPSAIAIEETGGSVPMYRGNAALTGVMPGPSPDSTHGIEAIWTFTVQGTGFGWSSPAVVGGVVYIGSSDGSVYAIDAGSGKELWAFLTGDAVYSSPAVVGDVVFVGSNDQNVYALGAGTGEELWRFTGGLVGLSSPVVVDGIVYIETVGTDSNSICLFALDIETGEERWRFVTAGVDGPSTPAVIDGTILTGRADQMVYALNAETGEVRWQFATENSVYSSPAVVDGTAYIGGWDHNVYALDVGSGEELWRFRDQKSQFYLPAVVSDGVVSIGNGNPIGRGETIFALSAETGEELWQFSLDLESGLVNVNSPTYADGIIYVGHSGGFLADDGGVFALRAETGELLWRFPIAGSVVSTIAVVDGVAYAGSSVGVHALVARTPRMEPGGTARCTRKTVLRGGPSPSGVERERLDDGTLVTVTGESIAAGGVTWWPVEVVDGGRDGWVSADDLEAVWPEE